MLHHIALHHIHSANMAETSSGLLSDVRYKCHPTVKFNNVICIICENANHKNKIINKSQFIVISNVFIICSECNKDNITPKQDLLSTEAKTIIARAKKLNFNQVKDHSDHNVSIYETDSEFNALRVENILVRDLNSETEDKNHLLKDKIDALQNRKYTY